MRLARAWDLYLALENAYEDLGGNLSNLLDASDKQFWNNEIHRGIKELWQETHKNVVDVPEWVDAITNEWAGTLNDFADVQLHEVQAGNWPLISYAALGVAALGFNGNFSTFSDDDGTILILPPTIIDRAIKAADFKYWDSNNKRMNYWWYQTGEGKEYWAEGVYYFELLLPPLIEFWHVIRSNDITNSGSKIETENNDPFNFSGFLNSIKWHYNIATPDGNTPPLDDGNKKPIESAGLLSWDASYGNHDLGKKFAYIRDLPEISSFLDNVNRNNSRLVEISYPHVQENQGTTWEEVYGNEGSSETLAQQTIVRKKDSDGTMHYLLMNGERGAAITSGEGHEQVDQLQLLYYVDEPGEKENSYLMDTGYDSGSPKDNSTWNHYNLHNVLSYNNAPDGGYNGPSRSLLKKRKVAEHASVEHLYFDNYVNIIHIYGQLPITHYNYIGQSIYYSKYKRNTLFITEDTDNNIPSYIIDSNADEVYPGNLAWSEKQRNVISMKYYSDTNILEPNNLFVYRKFCHTCKGASKDLYIYMEPVEALPRTELYTTQMGTNLLVREKNNQDIGNPDDKNGYYASSHGLNYYNDFSRSWTSVAYLQVNNLRPTPPAKQINYSSTNYKRPYQVWAYQHNANIVDIYIKRAKPNNESLSNALSFSLSGFNNQQFSLTGGKQVGFARLVKVGSSWEIDNDYKVNIEQKDFFFTTNQSIDDVSYSSGSTITISDNVTLTITGNVQLYNTEVRLGQNARIEVRDGGNIFSNGSTFERLNSSKRFDGVYLYTSGNYFENTTIEGGEYGIYSQGLLGYNNGANNLFIENSEIKNNLYGIYLRLSHLALIRGTKISNNANYGIKLSNSQDVRIAGIYDPYEEEYTRSEISFNGSGSNGLHVIGYSTIDVAHTDIVYNSPNGVYIDNTSKAYLGEQNGDPLTTQNVFDYNSSDLYIYNLARTYTVYTSSAWTVPARENYWRMGYEPDGGKFFGEVDSDDYLTDDPRYPNGGCEFHCIQNDDGEDIPELVLSASMAQNVAGQAKADNTEEPQQLVNTSIKLLELENRMHANPNSAYIAGMLKSYHGLLNRVDKNQLKNSRGKLRNNRNSWLKKYHKLYGLEADSLPQEEFFAARNNFDKKDLPIGEKDTDIMQHKETVKQIGETVLLLEVEDALRVGNFQRIFHLYEKYGPHILNKDNEAALLTALATAYEMAGEYGKAIGSIEEMLSIDADPGFQHLYHAPDFTEELAYLKPLMERENQVVEFSKAVAEKQKLNDKDLPNEFVLNNAYPNPFNPSTVIPFVLPEDGKVRIEVFDVTGRLVSVLANQKYQSGSHEVRFDAGHLSSGMYLLRAQYGGVTETQKITLVK
ncbi:MAG: T9SS type A sorting domain-containing protein [Balneolaceae bacterium]